MNQDKEREVRAGLRRNPFWIILILFFALACDYGTRMSNLIQQRQQLDQTQLLQSQNLGALAQAQQLESRLKGLSMELLEVARTNVAASQIVRDFSIQWNPGPDPAAPAPAPGSQQPSASSAKTGGLHP
jgi:hypothetical protein